MVPERDLDGSYARTHIVLKIPKSLSNEIDHAIPRYQAKVECLKPDISSQLLKLQNNALSYNLFLDHRSSTT